MRSNFLVVAVATAMATCGARVSADIRLEAIDLDAFSFGLPFGISGDGQTVVGSLGNPQTAFRWSAATSVTSTIPGGLGQPLGLVASYDGSTLGINNGNSTAHRYHNGMLTTLGPSVDIGLCSNDGNLLAGRTGTGGWIWTSGGGYQTLSNFAVRGGASDGSVLAGVSGNRAAIRSSSGVVTLLPEPAAGGSRAEEVSLDGSIVAGVVGLRTYRWVNMVPELIPPVPGLPAANMYVNGMSDDGNVLMGYFFGGGSNAGAWLWTPSLGTVNLRTYLQSRGVNVGGFVFVDGNDVSADGLSFTGRYGAAGNPFYLHFDSLPIPSPSAALPLLGLGLLARRRR